MAKRFRKHHCSKGHKKVCGWIKKKIAQLKKHMGTLKLAELEEELDSEKKRGGKRRRWLKKARKACKKGHKKACKSLRKAFIKWVRRASKKCKAGKKKACRRLKRAFKKMAKRLRKRCHKGHKRGCKRLGRMRKWPKDSARD